MSNEFMREERYIVFKMSDIKEALSASPEGWLHHAARMAALAKKLREPYWHFESIREMQRELCALEEAALAAAPEAKP